MAGKSLTNLSVGLSGDATGLANSLKKAASAVTSTAGAIVAVGEKLTDWIGIGAALEIGRAAIDGIGKAIKDGFETADKIEQSTIALTGLAGSAQNAAAIMQHLKNLSADGSIIPLDDLTAATRKMLGIGISADQIEPILKNLGDVAAGTGGNVGDMAETFVKVASEGSVSTKVLKELGREGIPIVDVLAARFHTSAAGIQAMAKSGQLGFRDLQAAFETMTGPGGKFAGLMQAQANTVGGTFTRLKTNLSFDFAEIAQTIADSFDFKGTLNAVMGTLPAITNAIIGGITVIGPYVRDVKEWIMSGLGTVWGTIRPPLTNAVNFIVATLPMVSAAVQTAMGIVESVVTTVWGGIWSRIGPMIQAITGAIADNWQGILEVTVDLATGVANVFEGLWDAATTIAAAIWDGVVSLWDWGIEAVTGTTRIATKDIGVSFGMMVDYAKDMAQEIQVALNTTAYYLEHIGDVAQIAADTFVLGLVVMVNDAQYRFDAISQYVQWFGRSFVTTLTDLADAGKQIFTNLTGNLVNIWQHLGDLMKGKTSISELWKPLTEGLTSHLEDMPKIADRQFTDLEESMANNIANLQQKLDKGLPDFLKAKDKDSKGLFSGLLDGINKAIKNVEKPKPLFTEKDKNPIITPTLSTDNLELHIQPKLEQAKLMRFGSGEAQLASYITPMLSIPGVPGTPGGPAVPRQIGTPSQPAAANVPGNAAAGAAAGGDWMKGMAADMKTIAQYILKWDSNPPIAAVDF